MPWSTTILACICGWINPSTSRKLICGSHPPSVWIPWLICSYPLTCTHGRLGFWQECCRSLVWHFNCIYVGICELPALLLLCLGHWWSYEWFGTQFSMIWVHSSIMLLHEWSPRLSLPFSSTDSSSPSLLLCMTPLIDLRPYDSCHIRYAPHRLC